MLACLRRKGKGWHYTRQDEGSSETMAERQGPGLSNRSDGVSHAIHQEDGF
jgi:hypothetical protein